MLKDVNLDIPEASFVGIIGPSGSGKTTLLKIMAGFLRPTRGTVSVLGQPRSGTVPRSVRKRVGYIPQQLGLVRGMTALDNALMGSFGRVGGLRSVLGFMPQDERREALGWLNRLGIGDKANEKVFRLSGGQRQRVAIARTLMQRPAIIFADEFVSNLDQPRAAEIIQVLKAIGAEKGISSVFTMHELAMVRHFADQIITVRDGQIEDHAAGAKPR